MVSDCCWCRRVSFWTLDWFFQSCSEPSQHNVCYPIFCPLGVSHPPTILLKFLNELFQFGRALSPRNSYVIRTTTKNKQSYLFSKTVSIAGGWLTKCSRTMFFVIPEMPSKTFVMLKKNFLITLMRTLVKCKDSVIDIVDQSILSDLGWSLILEIWPKRKIVAIAISSNNFVKSGDTII